MANPRTFTRRLLSSLRISTSRPFFCSSPYFSSSIRFLTRPNLISCWPASPSPSSSPSPCCHSFSIKDGEKPYSPVKVGPLFGDDFNYDPGRWVCYVSTSGLEFKSEEEVLDKFVEILVEALGFSEYEAKRRIFFVCHGYWGNFAFGARIDEWQAAKLNTTPYVYDVLKDFFGNLRDNSEEPIRKFSTLNWNDRLVNMFDYYNSNSECNNNANANATGGEDSGHWLINISEPDGPGPAADYCFELLAEFVGSMQQAYKKMYALWLNGPYGFGAEIDKETSKKLQEHPKVLQVLQDNSFDIKNKKCGILCVYHSKGYAKPIIDYSPAGEDDSDSSVSDGDEDTA